MSLLQKYFLRIYAREAHKGDKDPVECHREALFQTRLLAFLPPAGVAGSLIVAISALFPAAKPLLKEHRPLVAVILLICMFIVAFAVAGRATRKIDDIPGMAAKHATDRDRLMSHVNFWSTLLLSLSLPFVVALVLGPPSAGQGS